MLERGQRLLRAHAVLLRALAGGDCAPPPEFEPRRAGLGQSDARR